MKEPNKSKLLSEDIKFFGNNQNYKISKKEENLKMSGFDDLISITEK